jgi:CRP-like cAMP-binding protein
VALEKDQFISKILEISRSQATAIKKKKFQTLSFGPDKYVYLITSGFLLGLRSTQGGKLKGTGLHGPDDIIGLRGFVENETHDTIFYTLSDVSLKEISMEKLEQLLQGDVALCHHMMMYICKRYVALLDNLEQSALWSLNGRISAFKKQIDEISVTHDIDISEISIAMAVGAHPVSISRAKKKSPEFK